MLIHDVGHHYELDNCEGKDHFRQPLRFIKKTPVAKGKSELKTVQDGTTNEEVLKVLIHRLHYLQGKFPCRENDIALTHIESALMWLEKRTADRVKRGVEGKHAN
jgi:hypothetical protein